MAFRTLQLHPLFVRLAHDNYHCLALCLRSHVFECIKPDSGSFAWLEGVCKFIICGTFSRARSTPLVCTVEVGVDIGVVLRTGDARGPVGGEQIAGREDPVPVHIAIIPMPRVALRVVLHPLVHVTAAVDHCNHREERIRRPVPDRGLRVRPVAVGVPVQALGHRVVDVPYAPNTPG